MSTLSLRKIKHDSASVDNIALNSDGTTTMNRSLIIDTATNGVPSISLRHANTDADNFIIQAGTPGVTNGGLTIRDIDAAANRLIIDSAGRVTIPNQPAFRATWHGLSVGYTAVGAVIIYNTILVNRGNHYSTSNGRFTAPIAGLYGFSWNYYTDAQSGTMTDLVLNGSNIVGRTETRFATGNNTIVSSGLVLVALNANDYVEVRVSESSGTSVHELIGSAGNSYNYFNGYLIG
jgi:hypothetical protein